MRSCTVRFGGFLIFVGVLVLSLQYLNWSAFTPLQRADFVIAGGLALLLCFAVAFWSRSLLVDEIVHLFALVVGAAMLGLIISGSGAVDWANWAGPVRAEKTLSFDGSFAADVTEPSITLQLTNGDANVQVWDRDTYQIVVRARARGWSQNDAEKALERADLQPRLSATGIVFTVPRAPLGFSRVEAEVDVFLPESRYAELRVETLNGSLDISTPVITDRAFLKTLNGRITVMGLMARQSAILDTLNGRISGTLMASEAQVSTANGEIELDLGSLDGRYRLSALNGHISLRVAPDPLSNTGYSVTAKSLFGSVDVRLPEFTFSEQDHRRVEGATSNFTTAATKITIQANTTNGRIQIR